MYSFAAVSVTCQRAIIRANACCTNVASRCNRYNHRECPVVVVRVQEIRETDVSVCHFHPVPLNDRVSHFSVSSADYPLGASASNPLPSHLRHSLTTRRHLGRFTWIKAKHTICQIIQRRYIYIILYTVAL